MPKLFEERSALPYFIEERAAANFFAQVFGEDQSRKVFCRWWPGVQILDGLLRCKISPRLSPIRSVLNKLKFLTPLAGRTNLLCRCTLGTSGLKALLKTGYKLDPNGLIQRCLKLHITYLSNLEKIWT